MLTQKFGKRIQELRKQTGLSQENFALKFELDRSYLASIESGKRNPSLKTIKKLADSFGISLAELFATI